MHVRAFDSRDLAWAETLVGAEMGGRMQARRGELLDVLDLPGLVAFDAHDTPVGLLTYRRDGDVDDHEIAYLEAVTQWSGIGTALLAAFDEMVRPASTWLVTTNDNVDALRFYQRRGFVIREVRPGAVTAARASLKPIIPTCADNGIEIRDEIELVRVTQ